jgi:O-antigen ligase
MQHPAVLSQDLPAPAPQWFVNSRGGLTADGLTLPDPASPVTEPIDEDTLRWDPLLLCVAAYILIAVGRVHQLFPALELLHPAALAGFLGIVLYLIDSQAERRGIHLAVPTTKRLLGFTIWMILCVPGALVVSNSFTVVVGNFIKTGIMYAVVASAVRGTIDVERLARVYLASAVLYTLVVMSRFDLGSGNDWRLGHLYYYDANDFATYLVTAMPLGLYFTHTSRRLWGRLLAGFALVVLTLGFVWSGSRGGFLALAAVAAFILIRYSAIPLRWRLSAAALVVMVLVGTASDQYWRQMSTIFSDTDYNRTQETGRLQIWSRGLKYMLDNPLFGVGPGNFQAAEGRLSEFADRQQFGIGVRWNAAHNTFVQIGAETGIPGLLLFVALLVSAFGALRRSRHDSLLARDRTAASLAPALTASLLGFVVGSIFLSLAYSEMLYTLVALGVGLRKVTEFEADDAVGVA